MVPQREANSCRVLSNHSLNDVFTRQRGARRRSRRHATRFAQKLGQRHLEDDAAEGEERRL